MKETTKEQLNIYADREWIKQVDDWRAKQEPRPSRSVSIRTLTELGLSVIQGRERIAGLGQGK